MRIWKHLTSAPHICRPLWLLKSDHELGFRAGGTPPTGVAPPHLTNHTRYFATIPLDEDDLTEVSLFLSLSDDETDPNSISNNMYTFHQQANPLVQFVVHRQAKRGNDSKLKSEFEGRGLGLEAQRADSPDPTDDNLWTHHKIGGIPFFYHEYPEIRQNADALAKSGWVHLLQMTSLGYDDAYKGIKNWPIFNQMFHVFARPKGDTLEFQYVFA